MAELALRYSALDHRATREARKCNIKGRLHLLILPRLDLVNLEMLAAVTEFKRELVSGCVLMWMSRVCVCRWEELAK